MFNVNSAIGTCLGDYRLTETLTANASNFLLLAEKDSLPGQVFLVKVRRDPGLDTQEQQESFLQRADMLKAFRHPYVLPLLDAGIDQSNPYSITAYEKHGSLYDRIQKQTARRLPLAETHMLLARIGDALHTAHQEELIHGNLKAQNILFNEQNEAILADFSLFPSSPAHTSTTQHIAVVTLGYNKVPEPYSNQENVGASKEGDQYALGLIAYELFTGQRAFTMPSKSNAKKIYKVRKLISPRQINPGLDSSVEQGLLKALAKDPAQRYSDIPTFLAALGIAPDLAKHAIYAVSSADTVTIPASLPNEVVTQSTAIGIMQTKPVPVEQGSLIEAYLEQLSPHKTSDGLQPNILATRPKRTHKNLILILIIAVLVLLLSGVVYSIHTIMDSIHATVTQTQPATELSGLSTQPKPTTSVATSLQTPQNQVVPSTQSMPTATAQTLPNGVPTTTTQPTQPVTTGAPPQPACSVVYKKTSDSQGRFVATIAITNTGTKAINGWSLSWTYANGQSLYSVWGSTYQQNGAQVTLQNLSWDRVIQPGQVANNIGISGTYPHGVNNNPTSFSLNGMQCG